MQGGESGLPEGAGRPVGALLPEVPGAEPSGAEQRREGARDQPQGARHGAAEEGEPGESERGTKKSETNIFATRAQNVFVFFLHLIRFGRT